jgi:hypothetical protein
MGVRASRNQVIRYLLDYARDHLVALEQRPPMRGERHERDEGDMLLISRKVSPEDILRVLESEIPTKAARIAALLLNRQKPTAPRPRRGNNSFVVLDRRCRDITLARWQMCVKLNEIQKVTEAQHSVTSGFEFRFQSTGRLTSLNWAASGG